MVWHRGNSKSRIDRILINPEWLHVFPNLKSSLLNRSLSDHCPLIAISSEINWGPKPFRFINCWLSHPSCLKIIQETWYSSPNLSLPEKLKLVKTSLKKWNQCEFGSIESKISACEAVIQALDEKANQSNLSSSEILARNKAQLDLWDW